MPKVSKKNQEKTRHKIIEVAIDIMIQKGYEKATMREIARQAGVGDATIYNYFATKEKIIWGYISLRINQANNLISQVKGLAEFSLQEKLQLYFEFILQGYLPDRELLPEAFKRTHQSFLTHGSQLKEVNRLFLDQIKLFLAQAIASNEIPDQPIDTLIPHIILDVYFIIVLYWLKDTSDQFTKTTEFMDLILQLLVSILQQDIISKFIGVGSFLIRHHLFSQINSVLDNTGLSSFQAELKKFTS